MRIGLDVRTKYEVILLQLYKKPAEYEPIHQQASAYAHETSRNLDAELLLLLLLFVPALGIAEPLRVFASVLPIQTFVQKIGGEHVDARAMVRPGFNPHTYDLSPQQISALAEAALYVRTGVPFEKAWMERIQSASPVMQVLDARDGIALRELEAEQDPHVWTSPPLVRHMVGKIRDKLAELDPAHVMEFARNHDAFVAELDALDAELHALLDPRRNRKFMVYHPAWGYFADTYGLTQVSIENEGKEPGARALVTLIEQAKQNRIKVVFVQPQFDKRMARQVAQAIDGTVIAIDPLAADYVDNLRRVGRAFAQALQP